MEVLEGGVEVHAMNLKVKCVVTNWLNISDNEGKQVRC